jgi:C-terminal processing protease CtpA/Prc
MFQAFALTTAIIFDMRGYPNGTAWSLAPRLNTRKATHVALFHQPVPVLNQYRELLMTEFKQTIDPTSDWIYGGKTVMLIDDRTMSQAEHTGLFLEAVAGTTFIGTPSNGANGDLTFMMLPGRVLMGFTGQSVRHADGKQLQRLGLQPAVRVEPTLKGIRAGKDEVLDRAIDWVRRGK